MPPEVGKSPRKPETAAELKFEQLLMKMQTYIKYIGNFLVNFNKTGEANKTLGYAEGRKVLLNNYWAKFTRLHDQLEEASESAGTYGAEHEYFADDAYSDVESAYCEAMGYINDFIRKMSSESSQLEKSPERALDKSSLNNPSSFPPSVVIKHTPLPSINLKQFTGNYIEWPAFKDMFISLVHKDETLTDCKRLQYLKMNLRGDAEKLLHNISVTDANYTSAWKILEDRYDNKRILVNVLLKTLMSIPAASSESSNELKCLLDGTVDTLKALENLGRPVKSWDDWLIYITVQKLDSKTRLQWENSNAESNPDKVTFSLLKRFLENRIRALESVAVVSDRPTNTRSNKLYQPNPKERKSHVTTSTRSCPLCSGKHVVLFCPTFRKAAVDERRNLTAKHQICFNCLSSEHLSSACKNTKRCQICEAKHHTMLHKDAMSARASSSNKAQSPQSPDSSSFSTEQAVSVTSHTVSRNLSNKTILLATAVITLRSPQGRIIRARALLDQGSDATLLAASLLQKLQVKGRRVNIPITGVGASSAGVARCIVSLELLSDIEPDFVLPFEALVLPKLTTQIPSKTVNIKDCSHFSQLRLADPDFKNPGSIEIIIGADIYGSLLRNNVLHGPPGCPTAQQTAVGWILSGVVDEIDTNSTSIQAPRLCCVSNQDLSAQLATFWEIEEVPFSKIMSPEEKECLKFYDETTTRDLTGRYLVRLPLKSTGPRTLGDSRFGAVKSLTRMEKQFSRSPTLASCYLDFMREYAELNHMHKSSEPISKSIKPICYLPHHAIVKSENVTTKLRVVFNASFKTSNQVSLNDILHVGPKLQADILCVMMRWRKHFVAFSGDIEKMYRQILIHPEDRDLQRIVWRDDPTLPIQDYKLATVTYGMNCAPYLAIKTLHKLAEDEREKYPLGSAAIKFDTYVDDVLSGADTIVEALELQRQLNLLLKSAGFNLRKWASNHVELLETLDESQRLQSPLELSLDKGVKTLGLEWHPSSDELSYRVNLEPEQLVSTKRGVLSGIARLFDPMGWLSPIIISAKILMQDLWTSGLDWDTPLPEHLKVQWKQFGQGLLDVEKIRINRWIGFNSKQLFCELHGFSDASESAYAAAVYLRVFHDYGKIQVTLLTAKSRVAPLKRKTIPRLELCGALLLAKLIVYARDALNIPDTPIFTWTDSTTVLAWLSSHPSRWKSFIANRVSEIQTLLRGNPWRYVSTDQNPADCATRGLSASKLLTHSLWWNGPSWLSGPSTQWPSTKIYSDKSHLIEEKTAQTHLTSTLTTDMKWHLLNRWSSLRKLVRVTAYIMRFLRNLKFSRDQRLLGPLTTTEIDDALKFWIRYEQNRTYPKEIAAITQHSIVNPKSPILKLQPILDNENFLRVGGRLNNSYLSFPEKHPLIIPKDSFLTTLVIRDAHIATLHGGEKDTCSYILQKYWIPGMRRAVRYILHRCVICFKLRAKASAQIMAALPKERVVPSRPFLHSGVDYAGPISLRTTKGRGQKTHKGYICLFICFATKAAHLELVSDATSQAFIAAYKRFTSRRGIPASISSDNATTFVGSDKELQQDAKKFWTQYHNEVANALSIHGTQWRFIPASSPHFGGLWEANIKCVKYHLKRSIGETILTFEEMSTILCQIESCLNSRPLCPLSSDPTACDILTPGHFLIGSALNNVPEPNTTDVPLNRLSRWQLLQNIVEGFWEKWSKDYLHYLQQRTKWNVATAAPKVDDLVIVKERLPPSQWMLGRITQLHPGPDGRTRVVTLRSKNSTYKRPVVKVCVLPINDDLPPIREDKQYSLNPSTSS